MGNELKITRRQLPHWTIDGATYFVTFRSYVLLRPAEKQMVIDHLREGDGKFYTLIAAVVMTDHVHMLIFSDKNIPLSRIMKGIKGVSARKINLYRNKTGQVWQHESYDRIVRNGKELKQKFNYIANNPIKAGLTDTIDNYVGWYYNQNIII